MPQVMQVLQCYNCKCYQVHIVKKVPKWACKMCTEIQSVKKIFSTGSGQECRVIVQELNMRRATNETEVKYEEVTIPSSSHTDIDKDEGDEGVSENEFNASKWDVFDTKDDDDDMDETKYTFQRTATDKKRKLIAKKDIDSEAENTKKYKPDFKSSKWERFITKNDD
ncbi:PREDICTED: UPF0544 protein C5orf45 homolog [Nicrophorus vespilloides]|uniref:UPF0544 protein C5orf45 homolog n=1 Tax=Nicrophorus vespilloides TaxID=110193 RepID=A0ABM1M297_NICVS|nr:PREDICTED: UPF0544 protein C5orf45 homolog [Nicrophorus vespilloides]